MTTPPVRVLLIEDNPADVIFLRITLEKDPLTEFQVVAVERLSEGLEQIQHNHFDVILLDLDLPDCQGLNTFEQIRGVTHKHPIVVLSSLTDEEVATRAMQLGAQDCVVKGTAGWEAISRAIRYAVERQHVQETLHASEERYRGLFEHMAEGLAYCKMIFEGGQPIDWEFLSVNSAFSNLTGLQDVNGKKVSELIPSLRADNPELFDIYGRVAQTGGHESFEVFVKPLGHWFTISVYSPKLGDFVSVFNIITKRKQAEQALEDNEKRFRALIENGLDDISLIDAQGKLLWESPSVVRNLGYAPNEFVGRNIFEVMHPEDRGWTSDLFAKLVREPGSRQYGIFRLRHSDGSWRWVEAIVTNLQEEPSVKAVVVNYRDVTERKRAEENLRQSEKRYQDIFQYSADGIFQSTPDGHFLNANPALAKIYGYDSPRELIESVTDIAGQLYLKPEDRREFTESLQSNGTVENFVMKNFRKDGTIIWTCTSARAVRDEHGNILWYEGFLQDITERKQAEEARNEAELRYRALFEQSHDAIFILDLAGRFSALNQRAADMLGYSREELLGLSVKELSAEPEHSQQVLQRVINGERIPIYERLFRKKDGSILPVEVNVELVHGAQGHPLHIQSIVRDITDRKRAEIELQHRNDDLGLINAINEVIVQGGNLEAVVNVLAKEMKRIFSSEGSTIYMLSPDERSLSMQQYFLPSEIARKIEKLIGSTIPIVQIPIKEGGYFQKVLQSRQGTITIDPKEIQNWMAEFVETTFLPPVAQRTIRKLIPQIYKLLNIKSTVIVPLLFNGKIIGLLDVSSSGLFTADDLKRIENIGAQLTVAIQRQQANEKIQRSEEFLNSIQNALSASIAILDEAGKIVRVNSAWRKFGEQNGLKHPESCIGMNYLDICDSASGPNAEEAPIVARAIREIIAGRRKEAWIEYPGHSPEEKRWFILRITKFEDGDKIWVVVAHENITERRLAQDAVQRSEAILAQAGKMAHLGAWEIEISNPENLTNNPLHWSDEVYRIFGYKPEEVKASNDLFFACVHPDDRQKVQRAMSQAIAEKKSYEVVHRIVRPDGVERIVEEHADLIFDEHGQLLQTLGAVQDITERKKIEEDLKESSERFHTLFEASPEAIMLVDPRGDWPILDCNATAGSMNGYTREELIGQTIDTLTLSPGDAAGRAEYLEQVREAGILRYDDFHRRKDGSIFPIEVSTSLINLGGREVILGIDRDITERKRAENKLRVSEERFRQMADNIQEVFWMKDASSGEEIYASPASEKIWGRPLESLLHHPNIFIESVLPEDRPAVQQALEIQKGGKNTEMEYRITHPDGSVRWIWDRAFPIFDDSGKVVRLAGIAADITERKQSENALRESEVRFAGVVNSAMDAVISVDTEQRIVLFNPAAEQMFGCQAADALGQPLERFIPSRYRAAHKQHILRFGQTSDTNRGMGQLGTLSGLRSDGTEFPIEASISHIEASGQHLYTVILRDITKRKQAEEQLRQLSRAVEQSASTIVITDTTGRIEYVNPKFTETTGYAFEEALGQNPRILKSGRTRPEVYDDLWEAITSGKEWHGELQNRKRNGELYWESVTISPILNEHGETTHFIAVKEDVTERKQNETEIIRHLAELEALYVNGLAIGRLLEPHAIGERFIQTFSQYLSWHHVTIRLRKDENDELELIAFHLPHMEDGATVSEEQRMKSHVSRVGQGISGWVVQTGGPIRTSNLPEDPHYVKTYEGMQSGLYMPLKIGDRVIGVISVESEKSDAFSEQDERLLATLANQAATAFENARLYQSAQQEIWERRIAEEALRQSEEKYRRLAQELEERVYARTAEVQDLYDNAPCGYHSLDQDGVILRINQTELGWLGYTREEMIGHPIQEFITDKSYGTFKETFPTFKQHGSLRDIEIEMLRKDGSIFPILVSATAIYDKDGRYVTSRSTLFDDTDRKHALETLRLANSEMKRAMHMKDEFLASMSHELRTPLNAILGLSESLLEQTAGPINEKQQKYLVTVNESGRHLLELINDILDLAKIESGQIKIEPGRVNINTVCEASLRMIKQLAQKKNQIVEVEVEKAIEHVWADERRLKQMIVNLLSNAVKFTPEGGQLGLKVRIDRKDIKLLIIIWDRGIGIREEDLKRLFQPFVQLDSSLSRESAGTGLGLALVAEMARLHGGSVSVSSQLGQGSQFTIILPWDPAINTDTLDKLRISGKIPIIRHTAGDKQTILLVEDTDSVVMMVRDYLELSGYKVEIARDGLDGVSKAITLKPDLILMDVQMHGMDGLEATRRIRRDDSLKNTPIIALTALAMPSDRERCIEAGMNDYFSKPINLKELVKTMQRHLPDSVTGKKP